jgi:oligoendopeptidase F
MSITNTKLTWDFSKFYTSFEDPQIDKDIELVNQAVQGFKNKWESNSDYLTKPEVLLEALLEYEKFLGEFGFGGKPLYYLYYVNLADMTNTALQSKKGLVEDQATINMNKLQFFTQRISKITPDLQSIFLELEGLKKYQHFIKKLFEESKYLLTEEAEKVMNLMSKSAHANWLSMLDKIMSITNVKVKDELGDVKSVTFEEALSLSSDPNKDVRDSAAMEITRVCSEYSELAAWQLNSIMEADKAEQNLRGFARHDAPKHLNDDVESEVVDTMISAVTERFDISRKFYELKAKLLKVDKLSYHERDMEVGSVDQEFNYDKSLEILEQVTIRLHPEFNRIFKQFVEEGRVDVYPRAGKYHGAFCSTVDGNYGPVNILLNYTNKLRDVTTFAHELGHGINHQLMWENQTQLNQGFSYYTAETASTFMEDFVVQELEQTLNNDEDKLNLLMIRLNDIVSSVCRQTACENLQRELNQLYAKEGFVSTQQISELMQKHMQAYMGDYVICDKNMENWWVYWDHIRWYSLYTYVGGLLISKSMQTMYKQDNTKIELIKTWYGTGSNLSPKESFAALGIDITTKEFWFDGLNEIEAILDQAWSLAQKLGKI